MNSAAETYILPGGGASITALPKISLHDHLDGGLRPQTIIDLAEEIGFELPTTDATELAAWFESQSNSGSLVEYLKTFDVTIAVMQTRGGLFRVAREFVHDLAADGVIYGEVRWAPEQHLTDGLSLDEVVEAVQEGLEQGVVDAAESGHTIRVGQLVSAMRHADRGLEIAQLAVRQRDNGVVGFDIAGAEAGFPASKLADAFDYLAQNFLPVTVHAGEADSLDSIKSALFDGRALRIGHGVRIAEDISTTSEDDEGVYVELGRVAEWIKDRQIALELSPSSNLQTNAWGTELADHPFDVLYQLGFRVTVNVDNRLMSNTSLSKELFLLAEEFGYTLDDLAQFQLNAAAASFLSLDDRDDLIEQILTGFEQA
ncbi:adenosine deaminase [Conyzicola nivalis]|uniref:adenosine deaminase n=1 Tax=Conyzicola nivalis TaxID=1477021 RepID=A0A916SKG5_9MICO|nr:adenosine deaminase [Conyzicola nivalis]GGB03831.1 adenosine deaminase 1 [Conyzicola nivalis]